MFLRVRALVGAALLACCMPAFAAEKAFHQDDLADASIKLEAEIKRDAGSVTKPLATLRSEAQSALDRRDPRAALTPLSQIVATQPAAAASWLRLARTILSVQAKDSSERATLVERASTAAYVAYERATAKAEEAEALVTLGRGLAEQQRYRAALDAMRLSLELREAADVRATYTVLREKHGFRLLDYSVDSDAASPRACFQFSESLPSKRVDLSPFVAVQGMDKPAIAADDKQLCIEGLKHGERYNVTIRAGVPSMVRETLTKAAEYHVYVRDRKPFVRFTGRAYVLPRTGQRGIPVVSVNTPKIGVDIFRVSDRNLLNTVQGSDFQRGLYRYELSRFADEKAVRVWKGELDAESTLNADITTAFPVDQAVPDLQPGVYAMVAEPMGPKSEEEYGPVATQWFIVSDLGIASFSGGDGVHVFVNSLATTEPKSGIELRLISRSNEVLATRNTDANGIARFEAALGRGEGGMSPAMVVASEEGRDYAFLNLKGPAFDLSDRGVSGRAQPTGLDAYVYAERGVYRTGETVHLTALVRDPQTQAAGATSLTLVVERPDGVEYRRNVLQDQGLGGRALSLPLISSAPTGTWKVRAFIDPKGSAIGQTTFLVEDYVADRLEFELSAARDRIARNTPVDVTLDGRFLYGAPASGLTLDGEVLLKAVKDRPGFAGYEFGNADEEVSAERQSLEDLPETDAQGKARFPVTIEKLPASARPLNAIVTVRMAEAGGRAVERSLTLPVTPAAAMIGVKPLFAGKSLGEGEMASFDVVFVAPDGKALERKGLRYELLKIESRYQWYRRDNRWEYEPVKKSTRIADGVIDVATGKPGRIAAPVEWGRYRLDVSTDDADGPRTSLSFDAGFYADASADTPDLLEIALDKGEYSAGEQMTLAVTARTAGKVNVSVVGERMLTTMAVDVQPGTARIPLRVGSDWGSGAYVVATLRRPLDAQAQRMPGRALGVQWFSIDRKARTLAMELPLPDLQRPNTTLRVPVKIAGLAAAEDARVTVAAVDVGILNLTGYKPPSPDDYYLGQRKLSAEIRDIYGQLIDGTQGTRGQIRSGGDGGASMSGSPPTQAPLAFFSGVVGVGPDGTAEVLFDLPAFAGTVRVMAVGWTKDKVGHVSRDVTVRDPVVLTTTLPRFLLIGDRASVRLDLDNVEGEAGEYRIGITTQGPLSAQGAAQTFRLAAKQRTGLSLPISASAAGTGAVIVRVTGPGGFDLERSYVLNARPSTQVLARRTVKPLAKGETLTLSTDMFADLVPGTGSAMVSVGPSTALDVPALLQALDRYPFGCSEQITSRALPLLYVNELASEQQLALDSNVDQRIRDGIDRLLARQGSNGSFGLWSTGGEDGWLDAYVTDFLTRARERGFAVPDVAFKLALDRLRNTVGNTSDPAKDGARDLAYALYVLARNGAAPIGDMRYLADAKLDQVQTVIAKAQLAAALGLIGDRVRAERVYAAALASQTGDLAASASRVDYGSGLRDAAALVTLASEAGIGRANLTPAVQRVEAARASARATSTQENAWLILAARTLGKDTRATLDVAGEARQGAYYRRVRAEGLATPLRISNTGDTPVQAVVTVSGAPITPEPAAERGFKIERQYRTLEGEPADATKAKQNQRFVVVLKMTEPQPEFGRIIVADYLPAGFEIDNPRLVSSGDTGKLDWIENAGEPVHTEFRDERFAAAFDRKAGDPSVFTVAYVVRAVSPGRYVLPQAYVEDMYRPDRFGRTATGAIDIEAAR